MEQPNGKELEAFGIFAELQSISKELTKISEYDNFFAYISIGFSHIKAANKSIKKYEDIKDEVQNTEGEYIISVDFYFEGLTDFLIMLDIDYDNVDWAEATKQKETLRDQLIELCAESREMFLTFHSAETLDFQHFDEILANLELKALGDSQREEM